MLTKLKNLVSFVLKESEACDSSMCALNKLKLTVLLKEVPLGKIGPIKIVCNFYY